MLSLDALVETLLAAVNPVQAHLFLAMLHTPDSIGAVPLKNPRALKASFLPYRHYLSPKCEQSRDFLLDSIFSAPALFPFPLLLFISSTSPLSRCLGQPRIRLRI